MVILADPSTPSSIPSEEGSPSSVAPETPVCDALPIVPSIQPLNSRAPEDDFYEFFYNPIWEPSDEDYPATPIGAPSPMASSDMGDASPVSSGPAIMSSIDSPIPATSPSSLHPTPLRLRVSRCRGVTGHCGML